MRQLAGFYASTNQTSPRPIRYHPKGLNVLLRTYPSNHRTTKYAVTPETAKPSPKCSHSSCPGTPADLNCR